MARIIPDGWRELAVTGAAQREIETLAILADGLPDDPHAVIEGHQHGLEALDDHFMVVDQHKAQRAGGRHGITVEGRTGGPPHSRANLAWPIPLLGEAAGV